MKTLLEGTVNPALKLNADTKKALTKIVEDEYNNQTQLTDAVIEQKKEAALEVYKKRVGFNKLKDKLIKLEAEADEVIKQMHLLALDRDGCRFTCKYSSSLKEKEAVDKLNTLLDNIVKANQKPRSLKNSLLARVWVAETVGEALIVLREVLGTKSLPRLVHKEEGTHDDN